MTRALLPGALKGTAAARRGPVVGAPPYNVANNLPGSIGDLQGYAARVDAYIGMLDGHFRALFQNYAVYLKGLYTKFYQDNPVCLWSPAPPPPGGVPMPSPEQQAWCAANFPKKNPAEQKLEDDWNRFVHGLPPGPEPAGWQGLKLVIDNMSYVSGELSPNTGWQKVYQFEAKAKEYHAWLLANCPRDCGGPVPAIPGALELPGGVEQKGPLDGLLSAFSSLPWTPIAVIAGAVAVGYVASKGGFSRGSEARS